MYEYNLRRSCQRRYMYFTLCNIYHISWFCKIFPNTYGRRTSNRYFEANDLSFRVVYNVFE